MQSRFGAECFRLWDEQQFTDTLPTVSASLFLNLCWAADGDDRLAADYIHQGIQMGHRLDLFGAPAEIPEDMDRDELLYFRAAASTAWGMFNFVTYALLFLRSLDFLTYNLPGCGPSIIVNLP